MLRDAPRASLYRGKINLWVEDEASRSYLATLWTDPDIFFLIGGGNEGVQAITKNAELAGFRNVFAVIDRDLRISNRTDWMNSSKTFRTFILPVHEVENYLLDSSALAACPYNIRRYQSDEITSLMEAHARRLCWWTACCDVVAEFKRRFRDGCMNDPKYPVVAGETAAIDHVLNNAWYQKLDQEMAKSKPDDVRRMMLEQHRIASERLNDGTWRLEFAGKQILDQVATQIVDWTKAKKPVDIKSDLAKEVADWQVKNQAVPPDLIDLLAALKEQIK